MHFTSLIIFAAALLATCYGRMFHSQSSIDKLRIVRSTQFVEIDAFEEMMAVYDRRYATTSEMILRFDLFSENLKEIEMWNLEANGSATFGVTQFSDRTDEEKKNYVMQNYEPLNTTIFETLPYRNYAISNENWDWRQSGIVGRVRNQGGCGSCWAFATASVVESANAKAGRGLIELSEKQMVDCIESGCHGGNLEHAMYYSRDHGLPKESDYPYRPSEDSCHNPPVAVRLREVYILPKDENQMRGSVHDGSPISVAIKVGKSFFNYKSGVMSNTDCDSDLQGWHAVTAIGYGSDGGDNWLIKNSWGTGWGDGGFGRVRRGSNWCAITTDPVAGAVW